MSFRTFVIPACTLLIWLSGLADPGAAGQRDQPNTRTAIPFFQAEQLQVSNGIAVGLYSALTGQSFLYAVQLESQRQLARINDVGNTVFTFDGARLLYTRGASVLELELASQVTRELWTGTEEQTIRKIEADGPMVSFVADSPDGLHVIHMDASSGGQSVSPGLVRSADVSDIFLSSVLAVVLLEDGRAFWSRDQTDWALLAIDDVALLGVAGGHLIGTRPSDPGTLLQADPNVDQPLDWRDIYTTSGQRETRPTATDNGRTLTFVERTDGTLSLVWLPLDVPGTAERRPLPAGVPVSDPARFSWTRDHVAWSDRLDGRLFLLSAVIPRPVEPPLTATGSTSGGRRPDGAGARGIQWLTQQLGPSFVSREGRSARLIDSYEDGARAGWIYDAALAAIAFSAAGDSVTAAELLAGLEHLQGDDGSWVFAYHPDRGIPQGNDRYVGSMAWVVMAANFYEWETGDRRFGPMANRALDYLERFRMADPGSDLYGGFAMGPDGRNVFSTEHNADCYAAFLWRGRLDQNTRAEAIAEDVLQFVLRRIWMGRDDGAARPFFRVGARDATLYLDAQTWTVLAFGNRIPEDVRQRALQAAEEALTVTTGKFRDAASIVGLDDTPHPPDTAKVWAEGSEGMVAALLSLGAVDRARRYHLETARYQGESGGIPYATENSAGWSTAPSAAATAWFVLNELSPPRNPFDPGSKPGP